VEVDGAVGVATDFVEAAVLLVKTQAQLVVVASN
jgi:hypothetical protein